MANFLLPLLAIVAERARANFVQKTRQTLVVQEQFMRGLLHAYQDTELGRKYEFKTIKTIDQFRE
ncbi:MAG: GH3 auxin-responsive promoter, partial [Chroococcidiopsidaceae cyanobacterium CP_BM_ER_R8_30]|nr:GH3 auxin-responsive promoter [Chroococcidiopsidaceae cyanobacterium CP_BM_ER_R8_30]